MGTAVSRAALALVAAASVGPAATAAERTFAVVPDQSHVTVHVGRAGLFSFVGHEHEVIGPIARGTVVGDPDDPARSTVSLELDAAGLKVSGRGEPAEDVPKVQGKMLGPDVLDVARYPHVTFRSTSVTGVAGAGGSWELKVRGDLTLHGVTRALEVPVHVTQSADGLRATGRTMIRHTDFGMKPVSVAGVVKVKNELVLEFDIAASSR